MKYNVSFATRHFATDVSVLLNQIIGDRIGLSLSMAEPGKRYDLIVFTGGADIDPAFYGEENYHSYTNPHRDRTEREIFGSSKEGQKFLGICRGHQLLNAFYGGKLIQDIPVPHPSWHPLSNGWHVNSLHHQGVISLGSGVESLGKYSSGDVTVSEITRGKNFLSFQFHPEFSLPDPREEFYSLMYEFLLEEEWAEQSE